MRDDVHIHRVVVRAGERSSAVLVQDAPSMVTMLSGVARFHPRDAGFLASEGDVFWTSSQSATEVEYLALSRHGAEFACTRPSDSWLGPAARPGAPLPWWPWRDVAVTSLLRVLLGLTESVLESDDREPTLRYLLEILKDSVMDSPRIRTRTGGPAEERLTPALQYMHEHLTEPISLDVLAGLTGYSRFHFTRLFTEIQGDTPHHYLTAVRVGTAQRWFDAATGDTIAYVGRQCGFSSAAGFSRAFRRHVGVTPSEYRARHPVRS